MRRQGAKPVDEGKPAAPSYFTGQGFKLGDNMTQPSAPVKPAAAAAKQRPVTFVVYESSYLTIFTGSPKNYHILEKWIFSR